MAEGLLPALRPVTISSLKTNTFDVVMDDPRLKKMVMIALSFAASLIASGLYWLLSGGG